MLIRCIAAIRRPLVPGWFSREIFNAERVGIAIEFPPFDWTIAVTELRSVFFTEVDVILRSRSVVLGVAVLLALILSTVHLSYILRPLECVSRTICEIDETGDLSLRVQVKRRDEIGILSSGSSALSARLNARIETSVRPTGWNRRLWEPPDRGRRTL